MRTHSTPGLTPSTGRTVVLGHEQVIHLGHGDWQPLDEYGLLLVERLALPCGAQGSFWLDLPSGGNAPQPDLGLSRVSMFIESPGFPQPHEHRGPVVGTAAKRRGHKLPRESSLSDPLEQLVRRKVIRGCERQRHSDFPSGAQVAALCSVKGDHWKRGEGPRVPDLRFAKQAAEYDEVGLLRLGHTRQTRQAELPWS